MQAVTDLFFAVYFLVLGSLSSLGGGELFVTPAVSFATASPPADVSEKALPVSSVSELEEMVDSEQGVGYCNFIGIIKIVKTPKYIIYVSTITNRWALGGYDGADVPSYVWFGVLIEAPQNLVLDHAAEFDPSTMSSPCEWLRGGD